MTSTDDPLGEARVAEAKLRADLAAAVASARAAREEADRLDGRAALPGAVAGMAEAAGAQRARADRLAEQVATLRSQLREQEAVVARLEAEQDDAG